MWDYSHQVLFGLIWAFSGLGLILMHGLWPCWPSRWPLAISYLADLTDLSSPCMAFGHGLVPNARLCRKGHKKVSFSTFSFAFDSHVFNMRFRINGVLWIWPFSWNNQALAWALGMSLLMLLYLTHGSGPCISPWPKAIPKNNKQLDNIWCCRLAHFKLK